MHKVKVSCLWTNCFWRSSLRQCYILSRDSSEMFREKRLFLSTMIRFLNFIYSFKILSIKCLTHCLKICVIQITKSNAIFVRERSASTCKWALFYMFRTVSSLLFGTGNTLFLEHHLVRSPWKQGSNRTTRTLLATLDCLSSVK